MFLRIFSCIDNSLGKMDPSLLTDQQRMELVIAGCGDMFLQIFQDKDGTFLDVCKWKYVHCDDDGKVTGWYFWMQYHNVGTLSLDYLPESLRDFKIDTPGVKFTGTLDTAKLPSGLEGCLLYGNDFYGTISMTTPPPALRYFNIEGNGFWGECDLTSLPATIEHCMVGSNYFSGSLRLDSLPEGLLSLSLSDNEFTGGISLDKLPESL